MSTKVVLRWHTRVLGWVLVPVVVSALLFAAAAFDPALVAGIAEQRRGDFVAAGQWGTYNWIAGAVAIGMSILALKLGWRWHDGVAATADDRGLAFHRSVWRRTLRWNEVGSVAYGPLQRTGVLVVRTAAGDSFTIRQVDPALGPEFARAVSERWLGLPPSSPRL